MTDATGPSFRDFASQLFGGDLDGAARTLEALLALSPDVARAAAEHFRGKMTDPSFMPKAMSLRTAVAGSDDAAIGSLLGECFGLDEATVKSATQALRARYALRRVQLALRIFLGARYHKWLRGFALTSSVLSSSKRIF